MARNLGFLALLLSLSVCICRAATFQPISDRHRSAALELFVPIDGSFGRFDDPDQNPNSIYFVFFIFFFLTLWVDCMCIWDLSMLLDANYSVYMRFIYALRREFVSVRSDCYYVSLPLEHHLLGSLSYLQWSFDWHFFFFLIHYYRINFELTMIFVIITFLFLSARADTQICLCYRNHPVLP